jgi:hypothetical protein
VSHGGIYVVDRNRALECGGRAVRQQGASRCRGGRGVRYHAVGPGTLAVGVDLQPGTYRAEAGTGVVHMCYWARLSNLAGGVATVEIKASDVAFM